MKSIKNFENKNVASSMDTVKGGKAVKTGDRCIGYDKVKNGKVISNTYDWNPFNND